MPLQRLDGEVMAAVRADAEVLDELLLAVVGAAARGTCSGARRRGSAGSARLCSIETSMRSGVDMPGILELGFAAGRSEPGGGRKSCQESWIRSGLEAR